MSFYGNILYELTNAFAEIVVKNNGKDSAVTISPSSENIEVPAIGVGGRFILDSGNKWIGLVGNEESQLCKIYHSGIDPTNTTNSFTTLENPNSATDIIQLSPGALLSGEQVYYDEAGHVTGSQKVIYKLPISETEAELIELQEKMMSLEGNETTQNTIIENTSSVVTELNDNVGDIKKDLNAVKALVGDRIWMTTVSTDSITKAIGSIKDIQSLGGQQTTDISKALAYLKNEIAKRDSTINDISNANRAAMEGLIAQIEAQLGIEIDKTSIWPTS